MQKNDTLEEKMSTESSYYSSSSSEEEEENPEKLKFIEELKDDTAYHEPRDLQFIRPFERSYERAFNRYIAAYQFRSPLMGRGTYNREKRQTMKEIDALQRKLKTKTIQDSIRKTESVQNAILELEKHLKQLDFDQAFYNALDELYTKYNVFPPKKHSQDKDIQRELEINYSHRGSMSGFPMEIEDWQKILENGTRTLNQLSEQLEEENAANFERAKQLWKQEEDARRQILEIQPTLKEELPRGQKKIRKEKIEELKRFLKENRFQKFAEEKLPRARWYIERGIDEPSKLRKLSQKVKGF